jgi:PAS domain S-box-containing protein
MEGGILVSCNASAARILGRSVDQVAGVAPFEFSPPMQPSGKASDEKSRQLLGLAEKGVPVVFEWVFLRGGGDTVEAEVSLSKVDLPESKNFLLCFLRDISERKRALQQLKDSREQLRALAQRLDAVREDERRRLSRDLHDGLGQLITAIKIDLSLLRRHLSSQTRTETNETEHMLEGIDALLDSTLAQTRSLSRQLRDGLLDEEGVVAAMRLTVMEFVARTKIAYELKLPVDQLQMSPKIGLILLRVCQEALTNISRHAEASHFSVHLAANDGIVKLTIQDNGKSIAFDEIRNPHSLGILGMRERVASVGGIFNIQPGHGNGTQIHVEIPQHGVATVFGSRKQF